MQKGLYLTERVRGIRTERGSDEALGQLMREYLYPDLQRSVSLFGRSQRIPTFTITADNMAPTKTSESAWTRQLRDAIQYKITRKHARTRRHHDMRLSELLQCIKSSPAASLELLGIIGSITTISSLLVTIFAGISPVDPMFAIFLLFCSIAAWGMAKINARKSKSE